MSIAQVTFSVDDVKTAKRRFKLCAAKEIVAKKVQLKPILFASETDSLIATDNNAFIFALHHAYSNHYPFSFSPDDIWLLVCQGISIHIQKNIDSLKGVLLKNTVKHRIVVRNDNLVNAKREDWQNLLTSFKDTVKKFAYPALANLLDVQFTTTSSIHLSCRNIAMLEAVKDMFSYGAMSGCGIPKITLLGTKEDWILLRDKVKKISIPGLESWVKELNLSLQECINAFEGKVNIKFWKCMYKHIDYYGKTSVNGWVIKFFPYIEGFEAFDSVWNDDSSYKMVRFNKAFFKNNYFTGNNFYLSDYSISDFPKGLNNIDIEYENNIKETENFVLGSQKLIASGGFVGFYQDFSTGTVAPVQGWCIGKEMDEGEENINPYPEFVLKTDEIELIKHPDYELESMSDRVQFIHKAIAKDLNNDVETEEYFKSNIKRFLTKVVLDTAAYCYFTVTFDGTIVLSKTQNISNSSKSLIEMWLKEQESNILPAREYVGIEFEIRKSKQLEKSRRVNCNYMFKF